MSDIEINRVLQQMRAMAAAAELKPAQAAEAGGERPDFAALLKESIDNVNGSSQQARALTEAFERGDTDADLAQVMVAVQKASLSFEAMKQVRNKLLSAYQDIMSMPL